MCPGNISTVTQLSSCLGYLNYGTPNATDNCPGLQLLRSSSSDPGVFPPYFPKGVSVEEWFAFDASFNSASCSFSVIVTDNQPPSIGARLCNSIISLCSFS